MAGISSTGKVAVQTARANGFEFDVYDSELEAALQLMRTHFVRTWPERNQQALAVIRKAVEEELLDLQTEYDIGG